MLRSPVADVRAAILVNENPLAQWFVDHVFFFVKSPAGTTYCAARLFAAKLPRMSLLRFVELMDRLSHPLAPHGWGGPLWSKE